MSSNATGKKFSIQDIKSPKSVDIVLPVTDYVFPGQIVEDSNSCFYVVHESGSLIPLYNYGGGSVTDIGDLRDCLCDPAVAPFNLVQVIFS